jgi:hypothetical protein
MKQKENYNFSKQTLEKLPLQYFYFEKLETQSHKSNYMKYNSCDILKTKQMLVYTFYKPISRLF